MGKREKNKQERRRVALRSARALLKRGGTEALSMRRLSAECGFAINTLYALFGTRDGILSAIVAEAIDRVSLDIDPATTGAIELTEQVMWLSAQGRIAEAAYDKPLFRLMATNPRLENSGIEHARVLMLLLVRKGVEERVLRNDINVDLLSDQMLRSLVEVHKRWAHEYIGDDEFVLRSAYGQWLLWCGAATTRGRTAVLPKLQQIERELTALLSKTRGR